MGYFNTTYYNSLMHADVKRDLNGTSISKEKGADNKANNTSAYNHDYYIRNKEKWQDNKAVSDFAQRKFLHDCRQWHQSRM